MVAIPIGSVATILIGGGITLAGFIIGMLLFIGVGSYLERRRKRLDWERRERSLREYLNSKES